MKNVVSLLFIIAAISLTACTKSGDQSAAPPAGGNDEAVADGAASPAGAPDEMSDKDSKESDEHGEGHSEHAE